MKRTGLLLLTLLASTQLADAATLKPNATVAGSSIMLSDIFLDIPFEKDQVIGSAPAPGRSISYNTRDLAAFSTRYRLDWQATDGAGITLTRASQPFDAARIAEATAAALQNQGHLALSNGRTDVRLDNEMVIMQAPVERDVTLVIDNLNLLNNGQRFTAVARLMSDGQALAQVPVSGRVRQLVSAPVVNRALRKGDIIAASDLAWQDVELGSGSNDILMDADAMIGMTPRNALRPGLPLRSVDLLAPKVVTKGSLVTLTYRSASMVLSVEGRALADAAVGEPVKVMNSTTARTVEGVVLRAGVVRVGPTIESSPAYDRTAMN